MEIKTLAPGIEIYSGCFDDLDMVLDIAKSLNYNKVSVDYRNVDIWGKTPEQMLSEPEKEQILFNKVNLKIEECLKHYKEKYHFSGIETEGISFLRYRENDFFEYHLDEDKSCPRTTSVTVYLNDDYQGGEIEYEHFGIKFKPKAGDIALFCSAYPYRHKVNRIDGGIRYAAVAWYRWTTLLNFYPGS